MEFLQLNACMLWDFSCIPSENRCLLVMQGVGGAIVCNCSSFGMLSGCCLSVCVCVCVCVL